MENEVLQEQQADVPTGSDNMEGVAPVTPSPKPRKRKTVAERKAELKEKKDKILAELRKLNGQEQAEERKKRNHRLILIGAEVEKVYGKPLTEDQIPRLAAFLANQNERGDYFNKALEG